jgi:thioredoxin 1
MPIELNAANFKSEVLDSAVPVLVDFWGEHCAPCVQIAPILDQLAGELEGKAKVAKIDAHANSAISVRYGVRAVPNLLFFKGGQVMEQFIGSRITKQELRAKLEALM